MKKSFITSMPGGQCTYIICSLAVTYKSQDLDVQYMQAALNSRFCVVSSLELHAH